MPKDNESTKWLYEQLKSKGYNVGKDQAEFDNLMRNNKASREWAYKTATSAGLNVGKDQSEFDNLVAPRQQASAPTQEPANDTQESTEETAWKPTMQEKLAMNARLNAIGRSAQRTMDDFNTHIDNLNEYGKTLGDGHTVNSGYRLNPDSKRMERTYLTPTGERTFNKAAADAASREYRDAVDMTVGGQIRRAQNRLQELKDKAAARQQELHDKWEQDYKNNKAPLAAVLARDTYVPSIQSDHTFRALQAAIHQTEEQIKTLNEQKDRENGVDVGFWRGFMRTAGDFRSWDFGINDMLDAMTMLHAQDKDRPQTEQEKDANQDMMRAIHEYQQTEAMYGGNASFWNRAGMMTGYMPSFMLDFALTGGGYEGINVASRVAGKAATKALGKEAVKNMAEQGFKTYIKNNGLKGLGQEAANWTIKALGTTTDELLIRAPLMTNTVQAGDTAADIINRKLGDVTVDENGNYDFTNDKTWGSAIWQGEANSIVENYSEMFGTHLPEVASLKNLGKLANVIGAKRLSGVLSRANAGALGGITDTTRRIFGQMGVSDYLGEVSEEYYGQLWRTMLNLDDAYQQNADGTRTNLFATKQFHGDIWGGMALSMGLMGAGKTTMSAAGYLSMKHDVNKADAMASELLTPDVWEPLRSVIDMATNDNVGDVAERIVSDKELTNEEKAAVLNYMERSLYLRGANLAELVKSRGGEQDENTQRANDSYIDGYNAATDEEKQNAKNMYDLQRQKAEQILSPETLAEIDNDPMGALRQLGDDEEVNHAIIDYINAKQVYDGMIQRVRDDIDSRIEQSNTMIDSRVNRATGAIQGVTMKVQDDEGKDRRAYVLEGNLVMLDDGTGIDHDNSDESIVIRDAATGAIEMVSPDAILSMEQPVDPELEKQTAAEAIRQQFAGEAANRIDGVLPFNQGDTYTLTDGSGQQSQIQIVPNQDGIVDNGDGTVNVSSDGGVTVVPMSKDDIQLMSDATNRARVLQSEQQREAERLEQKQPEYSLNTEVTLRDEAGNAVRGSITADMNEDGQYEVYTESPINGRKVNLFTADELNALNYEQADGNNGGQNIPENGNIGQENIPQGNVAGYSVNEEAVNGITLDDFMKTDSSYVKSYYAEHPESMATEIQGKAEATADYLNGNLSAHDYLAALGYATGEKSWLDNSATEEEIEQTASDRVAAYTPFLNQPAATEAVQPATTEVVSQPQQSALEHIPKDDKGEPVYEQADADTAWDAIVEQAEGDEATAKAVADSMVADKEAELKKVEKAKPKGGTTVAEKIAAERERKNAVEQAKATLAHWQRIAQTSERRRQAAMAEQANAAAEAARLRREQEEKERAEREEADRIRREALNGVPDIIDDKPQDARARGYRRVNGEKVDRQQPLQAKQGKEVQVKFDDKNIPTGHVSLIEAEQLQPSHVNGRRNPLHFIDEAQPKERNDEASVMSARNIAANIRPEEITSSVTAYTGAPTVNARGEVIQGNNRSAALREMWAGQPEQAAKYKQYLADHAADFGLTPEDVEAMQHPVLVNMLDVADDDAITLGQFVAQDTESGGVERIKPKNIVQKMGGNMRSYANQLLKSTDDETSFAELVDRNGMDVLKWMQQKGYITPTQYKSAFDSKGNLTAEAKNDLKGIMYQSIFQNGNTHLEEMFGALPAKAQKAILATAYRDYDSPNAERMNMELQDSISAYYALSQMPEFADAKNYKEARIAAEAWKRQLALDDVTGESYLPSERYSNFAILLATMYKGQTQMFIQNTFKNIYDLVQGTQEETLFETPDNTPRTLVDAINEAINSVRSELLINEQFTYDNGQRRNNVLAGDSTAGQQGRQGSPGSLETGERVENGDASADRSGGTESDSGEEEIIRREEELASRVEVSDDDWQEGDAEKPTYKRSIIIDGKHTATQIDQPDEGGHYTGSYFEFDNKRFGDIAEIIDYIDNGNTLASKIAEEEAKVNVNPTEAQKEAGNYKKGHVRIGQFDVSIEQPKGSVRSGVDASGNKWETTMQNTYGYIRGTEGVDGDHIDVFLTNDIDGWNGRRVYIVDQYNEDGTFDEHKVMLGFNDEADAQDAYLSNYEKGWENKHKLVMTSVNLPDFEKWINSSHRKTKPFAEYKSVKNVRKYESRKKQWEADQTYIHNAKPKLKALIEQSETRAKEQQKYLDAVKKSFPNGTFESITIGKQTFKSVDAMADFIKGYNKTILDASKKMKEGGNTAEETHNLSVSLGDYTFKVKTVLSRETARGGGQLFSEIHRNMTYSCPELGLTDVPVHQSLLRNAIDDIVTNVITGKDFAERVEAAERSAEHNRSELEQLQSRENKPFEYEDELKQAHEKLKEYSELMKKEMAEKEAKYAEMDASVDVAENITNIDDDDVLYRIDNFTTNEEEANDLFRVVDDESEIERLNSEPTIKVYRAMSLVDGKLYPPMSKKIGTGNNRISQAPSEFGQWEVSDERPQLVEKEGTHKNHIYIVKDNGKGLWVAYNPYFHTSRNPLNDQFAEAYQRPNLVTVEVEVPESELTSGYQADGAKDPVGETKWNAGPVNRQLSGDKKRKVILSRWMRPVRIVPDSEVAERIAELIEGENVAIPDNTVTPSLLSELKKLGVKIVDGINKGRKKSPVVQRSGEGTLTDDELSLANDPVAKLTGKSTRTSRQRREFAERERERMAGRVQELAEKLHLDNVDIVTDASTLNGRRARAKGFYSRSTGRITIVIPNHSSMFDVEQTLLHEAVAHYGLRQLFGEHFDTFLRNVYENADVEVRQRITELASRNGWDYPTATEEYLASLAENTNFENIGASWWNKIKELFLKMLHKIGFENFTGVTLSDNELRYILWRSYENLAEPGRYRSILGEAEDVAMQNSLKVGNYAVADTGNANKAADDAMFRDGDPEVHERAFARRRYEERVKRGMFQTQEALQDSMLGLREAMDAILKGEGKKKVYIEDVDGFENAYLGENRLSSVNKAEADAFAHILFKPLLDEVARLAPGDDARQQLTDYMMAKHGLERNSVMRQREKDKLISSSEIGKQKPQPPSIDDDDYDLKMDAYTKAVEDWENQVELELGDKFDDIDKRDFAGLTALTGLDKVSEAEAEASQIVDDYENDHDTSELWKRVNDVSGAILSKLYETGMMSKKTYDDVSSMYEYYIPLRGFDEKTSKEAYAYLNSKDSAFTAPIKTAKGRKSKADDPFAYLQNMAESAIMQGNRNKLVKQKFLNFVLNHPSDLASVSDLWLEYDKTLKEWKPVFPNNIESDDTPEEVERKMQDFEDKMKELAEQEPDRYKHGKDAINIPYRVVESRDLHQHQVVVKRNGRDYVITINGNPRAAQALNGQTNPDNDMSGAIGAILKAGERINRELSALYTTRNPDFVVSNFIRDMLYANSMVWIKESPNYALRYHRNFAKVNPVRMKILLAKYRKNTLDMNNDTERMFKQFMMNGGETGYANIRDIDKRKNDIRRELRKANGRLPIRKAWDLLSERFDEVNRAVENCARFAVFMTSREMGRTIDRAVYDAKDISVNFNKKGSGAKFMEATGQTALGNASAFMSGLGRSGFVFWNAAIQGTTNFGRQIKRHPAKALSGLAAMFLLGAVVASLGYGDDDDDDKNSYWNLPEYVRRSNILFRIGDQWISIPLPVEYRAVYGLGELMISTMSGKEHLSDGELANAIAGQVSQILPLDILEGGGGMKAFIPSSIKPFAEAYGYNKSWTGLPIYKDTPYNKDMPEWTKAYKSANKYLVDLSEVLNEATGGDKYTKGKIDINPAKVEYVLTGYFGGVANTIDRLTKMGETFIGQREYDPKSFLILNRVIKNGDERTEYKAVNNEYFRLKEEHDKFKTRLRHYESDTNNGIFDYAEKIDFLYNSPEYERYEIFENYRPSIDEMYDILKEITDDDERKSVEADLNELKKMMISDMNETRNRK